MFVKNHLEPFVKAIRGRDKVQLIKNPRTDRFESVKTPRAQTLVPMVQYFAFAAVGGFTLASLRQLAFSYSMAGPDDEELEKALQDEDTARAVALGMQIAFEGMLSVGGIGILTNPYLWTRDFANRKRAYDPTDPPGIAIVKETLGLATKAFDQGRLTASDIQRYAESVASIYRTARRAAAYALGSSGSEMDFARLEVSMRDRSYARRIAQRYAQENGITGVRRSPGAFGATENSPVNGQIFEALMLGEPERAKAILRRHLDNQATRSEYESALLSAKSSVRSRQPVYITGASSNAERRAFFEWADQRLTSEAVERIRAIDKQYRDAATAAGLLAEDTPSKVKREDRRRAEKQEAITPAEREKLYRKLELIE